MNEILAPYDISEKVVGSIKKMQTYTNYKVITPDNGT